MLKRKKILKVLEILMNQHKYMQGEHRELKSNVDILKIDEQMLERLQNDYNDVINLKNVDEIYSDYEDQILLRKL